MENQMLLRDLLNEGEKDHREIFAELKKIEKLLPRAARFKEFEVDMSKHIVYWVTQEMKDPDDLMDVARQISEQLFRAKCGFWSVWTCLRDNFNAYDDSTDWVKYETL
jgi:hypothetical protein